MPSILSTVGVNKDASDPIIKDEARLERAAAVLSAHGDGLRDVINVCMTEVAHEMVHKAPDDMTLLLRHQIVGMEKVYIAFMDYLGEYTKRKEMKQKAQDSSHAAEDKGSPPPFKSHSSL
mgnify:CR=1 FL=1